MRFSQPTLTFSSRSVNMVDPQPIPGKVTEIPDYGLKVKLDHTYPGKGGPFMVPKLHQIWVFIPLFLRYIVYYVKHWFRGRLPLMDYVNTQKGKQIYGVPLGGIGAGTIGRGFRGEFCRFQLTPGLYKYNTVFADQFIVTIQNKDGQTVFQSLLSTYMNTKTNPLKHGKPLSAWRSNIDPQKCQYTGLYPRAWTEYDLSEHGIILTCRQISPVIPHNYKDSSLPCSVFVWSVKNTTEEEKHVTIAFTFKNGIGEKSDRKATCNSKAFSYMGAEGVLLYNTIEGAPCKYALSVKKSENQSVTKCLYFDPESDGSDLWNQLGKGGFDPQEAEEIRDNVYGEIGCGVASKITVNSAETNDIEFSLVWDMPVVTFVDKSIKYKKFYTRYFTVDGAALKLADYALKNYKSWENDIYNWQKPILEDNDLPDWYKGALFNETYFVSDGGTVWFDIDQSEAQNLKPTDARLDYGRFAYLEGHEYRMYNTYDVHFYASFALVMNWPKLQIVLQYDFRDSIFMELPQKVETLYDGKMVERKVKNSVPHDVGDPAEEPFRLINSYPIHDVSEWRDLNSKFVLQVYRDYHLMGGPTPDKDSYLSAMFDACNTVMQKSMEFDTDGDGLIENSGSADQTYDTWVMQGSSAYCGGLWLGALYAMIDICNIMEDKLKANYYTGILHSAKTAFNDKLWNGQYYNFDCSKHSRTIMADQLCGHWYLRCCKKSYEVFHQEKVEKSLKTVFENNVMSVCGGEVGASNGYTSKGIDEITIQSEEIWTGVTYALASHMMFEGLEKEAWATAGGMYKTLTEFMGMAFETPEAIYANKNYRSIGYMRPLSIWAIQLAWQDHKRKKERTKVLLG